MRNISDNVIEKIKHTSYILKLFLENRPVYEVMLKMWYRQTSLIRQYGPCILYAGYIGLQPHNQEV